MTVINGRHLLHLSPIDGMIDHKAREHGVSYGLGEAGYDIRIKQEVRFCPMTVWKDGLVSPAEVMVDRATSYGNFTIASSVERFTMPPNLVGQVADKSTWARRGLSVFNTIIEPGWEGYLTLELVYHGQDVLNIPPGAGIAQVLFTGVWEKSQYEGKYQGQDDHPVPARFT